MAISSGSETSYVNALVIAASNTTTVNVASQSNGTLTPTGIYVGSGGNLSVTMASGANVVFQSVPAGTTLKIRFTKVLSDTTANNLVALF